MFVLFIFFLIVLQFKFISFGFSKFRILSYRLKILDTDLRFPILSLYQKFGWLSFFVYKNCLKYWEDTFFPQTIHGQNIIFCNKTKDQNQNLPAIVFYFSVDCMINWKLVKFCFSCYLNSWIYSNSNKVFYFFHLSPS